MINGDKIHEIIWSSLVELGYIANIDRSICQEIDTHWRRDIKRLTTIHNHEKKGLGVEKGIGYLAFWIRKLQPLSQAHPYSVSATGEIVPDHTNTNNQINEIVSIYSIKQVLTYYLSKKEGDSSALKKKIADIGDTFTKLFAPVPSENLPHSKFLSVCLYDMRFRTFGPHHLTHAVRYIMDAAGMDIAAFNRTFSQKDELPIKKIAHMIFLVSAPGDIQSEWIKPKIAGSEGLIYKLFKENYKEWINQYEIAATVVALPDFSAGLKNPQTSINDQILEINPDAYIGIIDSRFGTPTVEGFASGTSAEFDLARQIIADQDMISFGFNKTPKVSTDIKSAEQAFLIAQFKEKYPGLYWEYMHDNFASSFITELEKDITNKIKKFKKKYL